MKRKTNRKTMHQNLQAFKGINKNLVLKTQWISFIAD